MDVRKKLGKVLFGIGILIFTILMLFPFLMMLSTSLKSMSEINSPTFSMIPKEFAWSNFSKALSNGNWKRYFANSIYITGTSTVIAVVINSMAGFAFARLKFRHKNLLFTLVMVGMIVPTQVIMLPAYVIMKYIPFAGGNSILGQGGTGLLNTQTGLILMYLSGAFGVFLFRQFMMNFPSALDDAAKIDGLSRFGTYLRIYMPLSKPVIATMVVLRATATWNDYMWPLLMTPKDSMYTVQLALSRFRNAELTQWNYVMAVTAVSIIPVILLFLFFQKYFIQGIVTTGMKD